MEPLPPEPEKSPTLRPHRRNLVFGLFGALLLILVGWFVVNKVFKKPEPLSQTQKPQATIEITAEGFVPKLLTVKPDTTIVWINKDSRVHHIESNPYPEATEHPSLNSRHAINSNDTYIFEAQTPGEYNYHDRLHPELGGRIIVQQ